MCRKSTTQVDTSYTGQVMLSYDDVLVVTVRLSAQKANYLEIYTNACIEVKHTCVNTPGVQQAQGAAELSGGVLGILPLLARVA